MQKTLNLKVRSSTARASRRPQDFHQLEAPQPNAVHGGRVAQLMWIKTAAERFGIDNILELASQGLACPYGAGRMVFPRST
jgi:hypothetical protein